MDEFKSGDTVWFVCIRDLTEYIGMCDNDTELEYSIFSGEVLEKVYDDRYMVAFSAYGDNMRAVYSSNLLHRTKDDAEIRYFSDLITVLRLLRDYHTHIIGRLLDKEYRITDGRLNSREKKELEHISALVKARDADLGF